MKQNFNDLYNYRNAFKITTVIVITVITLCLVTVVGMFYIFTTNQTNSTLQIWVKTQDGSMFEAKRSNETTLEDRIIEYKHHVKWFYSLWYTLNRANHEENVNTALNLVDKKTGEELLDIYVSQGVFQKLLQTGRSFESKIEAEPEIKVTEKGIKGLIKGTLKFFDEKGVIYRNQRLDISFELEDILLLQGRNDINPHGVSITSWIIVDDSVIETTN